MMMMISALQLELVCDRLLPLTPSLKEDRIKPPIYLQELFCALPVEFQSFIFPIFFARVVWVQLKTSSIAIPPNSSHLAPRERRGTCDQPDPALGSRLFPQLQLPLSS
ncbi:uncharacterized protein PGTG_13896 [Puccinia graminis f. sp. tritici CRL 75-36-700-3]|uniref:Uncharacterized protein n=1 Tax=Puccinia graminis f. sp. tritici (strain CRL 75-36-700-3 / race SCCL) TaxID=418459 RepID=E3KTA0_PUCGT|nr:uncharacterized protein PGTG_13896 [Puccinia graminis f. sp. tritici CRL 75-36-700-3]EFP87525.1 hypothetical protein PGTG_13896 [Puccinia graminis f. sp. tritici CRL 75-36-700-3]